MIARRFRSSLCTAVLLFRGTLRAAAIIAAFLAVSVPTWAANITMQPGSAGLWTLSWPPSAGTNGYLLETNGSGTTSWIPMNALTDNALNAKMSVTSATTTGAFSADDVAVATALNGIFYNLPNYSETINLSTTGAGGMDTGSAPASGFVSIYAIYNPTTPATSILAANTATTSSTIYSGSNMPSGYTASALIGIWPTNSSKNLVPGLILDRHFFYQSYVEVMTPRTGGNITSQSVSSAVPAAAKTTDLAMTTTQTGSTFWPNVSGDSTGTGGQSIFVDCPGSAPSHSYPGGLAASTWAGIAMYSGIPLITSQTVYWSDVNDNGGDAMFVSGYTW
jgi:hypothetical protein